MYKIQTLNKISAVGLERFPRAEFELASGIEHPDAILVRSQDMLSMEIPATVKAVARAGAGTNNIPIDRCTERGIVVFNTPGANANSVKELVIASLFLSSRRIVDGICWAKTLTEDVADRVEKEKSRFAGPEIKGKKLAVVGLGAIGVLVANAASALGMDVSGYDPFISIESAWGLSREVKRAPLLDSLIAEADYITLHLPLNDHTEGIINRERLKRMRKGVRILNFARGGLIDRNALIDSLNSGIVDRYVTDFPVDELAGIEGVIPIPHLGASTPEAEDNCAIMAADQLIGFLTSGNIRNSVNFPSCEMPMTTSKRIIIANRNIPNMVGQVTTVLAAAKINIAEMLNRHLGNYAYNIIDVDGEVPETTVCELSGIEGVVMARVIDNEK
jgi:D-3-phosphoglycerate dehydrogenase / 2-oxoglutarate reductase